MTGCRRKDLQLQMYIGGTIETTRRLVAAATEFGGGYIRTHTAQCR